MTNDEIRKLDSAIAAHMMVSMTDDNVDTVARDILKAYDLAHEDGYAAAMDYLARREMQTVNVQRNDVRYYLDGLCIEILNDRINVEIPKWEDDCDYRVKPEIVTHSVCMALDVYGQLAILEVIPANLHLQFDPVTKQLISAQMVKP